MALTLVVVGALVGPADAVTAATSAGRITVVGDSLTVGTSGLAAALEADGWADARVDAKVGRHINTSGDVTMSGILTIRSLRSAGWDTPDWVVALGTNDLGAFTSTSATATYLQRIVDEIGTDHRIAFVALALPTYPAQSEVFNSVVRSWAATQPTRFAVIDWDRTALGHPEWFASDQIHLNSIGYGRRTTAVVSGVAAWRSTDGGGPDIGATTPVPVSVGRTAAGITVAANERVVDTRIGLGLPDRLAANSSVSIHLADLTTVPAGGDRRGRQPHDRRLGRGRVPVGAGAAPGSVPPPVQNFGRSDVVASLAIIDLDDTGSFCALSSAATDLLVDIDGWLVDTGAPTVRQPALSASTTAGPPPAPPSTRSPCRCHRGRRGAIVNLTVDGPAGAGYVSAHDCDASVTGSNVNFSAGETGSNLAIVAMSSDRLCIDASVPAHVIVDPRGRHRPGRGEQHRHHRGDPRARHPQRHRHGGGGGPTPARRSP